MVAVCCLCNLGCVHLQQRLVLNNVVIIGDVWSPVAISMTLGSYEKPSAATWGFLITSFAPYPSVRVCRNGEKKPLTWNMYGTDENNVCVFHVDTSALHPLLAHGVHHQTLRISILSLLLTLKGCNGFKNYWCPYPPHHHTHTHKPYQPIKYEPNLYGNLLEFLILPLNSFNFQII